MTMPQVVAEIAFLRDATDGSALWRNVTDDVDWTKGVTISRRRSHELDEVTPGTLSLTLENHSGDYTAGRTASPHYPNVRINRQVRIRARWPVSANMLLFHQAAGVLEHPDTEAVLWSASQGTLATDLVVFPGGQTSSVRWDTGTLAGTGQQLRLGSSSAATATSWGLHVTVGATYSLRCQARRDASLALSVNARIRWFDADGAFLSESAGSAVALSTSFQAVSVSATAPAGAVWARAVVANTTTTAGSVAVYVGAAQFEQAASPTTWVSPGVEYVRFSGFVDKWPHAWTNGVLGVVNLTATDRQKLLARQLLGSTVLTDDQVSGARAEDLLAAAGVTDMVVDDGLSVLGLSGNESTQSILALLKQVARSEAGLFFIGGDGSSIFQDRGRRQRPAPTVLTLAAEDCEGDLNFVVDDALLVNDVTVITDSGAESTATDAASIGDYETYSKRLDTLLTSTAEAADRAAYMLSKYAEPAPRAGQITVKARTLPDLWEELLASEIGQRIQITDLPDDAPTGTLDLWIEGVRDVITDEEWTFTIDPSPAALTVSFILDDPTYGTLDNNRLGW